LEQDLQKCLAPLDEVVAFWTLLTEQLGSEKRLLEFRIQALEKHLYGSRSEEISVDENQLELSSTVFVQVEPPVTADVVVPPDLQTSEK
jgi:Transposase C of IS166 homeodomain